MWMQDEEWIHKYQAKKGVNQNKNEYKIGKKCGH